MLFHCHRDGFKVSFIRRVNHCTALLALDRRQQRYIVRTENRFAISTYLKDTKRKYHIPLSRGGRDVHVVLYRVVSYIYLNTCVI